MKQYFLLLISVCLLMTGLTARAQERVVTGRVTGQNDGSAIPGVNVAVKGSTRGSTTDVSGSYRISVPDNAVLVFSFVGMLSREVPVGNQTVVNVELVNDTRQLEEVVVTALGIERSSKGLGFSQTSLKNTELTVARTTNLVNALNGKIPGVRISGSNGMTGSSSSIFIRGFTTFTQSNQPLFVVDGIPIDNGGGTAGTGDANRFGTGPLSVSNSQTGVSNSNRALDLNQDDIETITVLKGPAAAALYGSRAAGGVIMVTTKKGKYNANKKNTVSYTGSYNIVEPNRFPDYQNEYARGTSLNAAGNPVPGIFQPNADQSNWGPVIRGQNVASAYSAADRALFGLPDSVRLTAYPNNVRDMFRQGYNMQHNLSFSGASERTNYYFSYGMLKEKGFMEANNLDRHTFTANASSQLTNRLTLGTNIQYIYNTSNRSQIGNQLSNPLFRGWFLPRDYDLANEPWVRPDGSQVYFNNNTDHPYWTLRNNKYGDERSRLIGNVNATFKFTDWLSYNGRIGTDMFTERRKTVDAIGARGQANHAVQGVGAVGDRNIYRQETSFYNNFTVNRQLMEGLNLTALFGNEINLLSSNDQIVVGNTMLTRDFEHITNTINYVPFTWREQKRLFGLYGSVSLNYKGWANFEATGRNDWSSTFRRNNRSYFYPSFSGSLIATDALEVLRQQNFLTFAKFKAAWAKVGREASVYSTDVYFEQSNPQDGWGTQLQYPFQGQLGRRLQDDTGNPQLGPEFTRSWEVGGELRFWQNRIGLDLTYFDQRSTDIILQVPVAGASGFTSIAKNAGELKSNGWEWSLSFTPIKRNDLKVDFAFNGSRVRNNVISLAPGVQNVSLGPFTTAQGRIEAGQPFGVIYANTLLRDAQGRLVINPTTGLPIINTAGVQRVGDPNPRWTGGVVSNVAYKGLALNFLIEFKRGGDILSRVINDVRRTGSAIETAERPRFDASGQPTRDYVIPGVLQGSESPNNVAISSQQYWSNLYSFNVPGMGVFDGSWTRLREASLTYTLPKSILQRTPFGTLDIGINGRNLLLWTKVPHIDPEVNVGSNQNVQGIEFNTLPQARTYGVVFRASF
ncbi:SusC/RagA family TonB-linked outer membrane protein [Tellurirhabdus rosea]|uniref:SusC/RagA family TonB-linked outer membrane protein n=1 Tax=Tellurirhabdus rosea TaxID=2674997 RepID=UPI00224CFD08|nr:SusC/RagA family TonB-linked outer membrane protein [Tellurirhabdus rosea]